MSKLPQQIEEAKEMYDKLKVYISEESSRQIAMRIKSWAYSNNTVSQEKGKSLPPLVMTSGGLPKPLNPLFFKLKK